MLKRISTVVVLLASLSFMATNAFAEQCKRSSNPLKSLDFRILFVSGEGKREWVNIRKRDLLVERVNEGGFFNVSVSFERSLKKLKRMKSFKNTGVSRIFLISKKEVDRSVGTLGLIFDKNQQPIKMTDIFTDRGDRIKLNVRIAKRDRKSVNELFFVTEHACEKNRNGKFVAI